MLKATLTIIDEVVTASSVTNGNVNLSITQGASIWESDGTDHVRPKGGKTVDAPYLELSGKQDAEAGKGLSTNDFTDDFETKLTDLPLASDLTTSLGDKVDKVTGKELSDNNYTDAEVLIVADVTNKVDKVAGKELSDNNYTDAEQTLVGTITGKEVYHGIEAIGTYVFSNADKTLTVPSVTYWYQGVKYTAATPIVCDLDLTTDRDNSALTITANTLYYFYFKDATGKLYWSTNSWNLKTMVPVVTVFWNGSTGAVCRETHSHTRDLDWHSYNHTTIGTRWQSGLALTFTAGTAGSANPTWSVSSGTVWDEDLKFENLSAITQAVGARVFYQISATAWSFTDSASPFKYSGANGQYVRLSDYSLQALTNNQYINVWVYGTGDIDRPIYFFQEAISAPYNTAANARAIAPPSLANLGLQPELKLLYRLVVKGDTTLVAGIASDDYRNVTSLPSGSPTTQSAASVTFSPSGTISATSVQGALEELDTEKELLNNKKTALTDNSDTFYPSQKAVKTETDRIQTQIIEKTSYGVISGLVTAQQTVADMTVKVSAGTIYMLNGDRFTPLATASLAVTTADATNPRIDIIYVSSTGVVSYLAGTAAASPAQPATPAGGQLLATILVTAGKTSILTADITDRRKRTGDDVWYYPTLLNGATGTIRYKMSKDGMVSFDGVVTPGTPNVICVIPSTFARRGTTRIPLLQSGASTAAAMVILFTANNWNVYLTSGAPAVDVSNASYFID